MPTEPNIDLLTGQVLQRATECHKQGRLSEAQQLYSTVLAREPNNYDAINRLGILKYQRGELEDARRLLASAIIINPGLVAALSNYATVLVALNRFDKALEYCDRALALKPDEPDLLYNRGNVLLPLKRYEDALTCYDRVLSLRPHDLAAINARGKTLLLVGRPEDALACYESGLAVDRDDADTWYNHASVLMLLNRFDDALGSCRSAVAIRPGHEAALITLGNALLALARFDEALASYDRILSTMPNNLEALCNRGVALMALEKQEEALASFDRALAIAPADPAVLFRRGDVLLKQNRLQEALASLDQLQAIAPDHADTLRKRGNILLSLRRFEDALTCYDRVLVSAPKDASALNNRAVALLELRRPEEALESYDKVLEIQPTDAEAWYSFSNVLVALNRFEEALAACDKALDINPDHVLAHNNRGNLLGELRRLDEALASYERALQIEPDNALVLNNRGTALFALGRHEEALASYDRVIAFKPDHAVAHSNHGTLLNFMGRPEEALRSYQRAKELDPAALQYAIQAHLLLPVMPGTSGDISDWRARYQAGLATLIDASGSLDDPGTKLVIWSFQLAYHNYNDRPVMESLCRLFRARVPALTAAAPHLSDGRPAAMKGQRIRVGFLSEFFVNHTIGKLYQGLIRHLDRRRFEVVVIHAPKAKRDALSQSLGALADKTLVLPVGLAGQQSAVAAAKLDVLFYPDIGMSSSTYFLAYARLAGIQVVSWGHPATTGLDTIDYFVSAGSIEPEDAQDHYTERLICLNRMPCCYQALTAPTRISSRTALGLPERCTLYGCPQSLFKIHPDFDAVLAAIAEGDPTGRIVLLEGLYPAWKCLLQTRWETTFPILLQRVLFLPRLPPEQFMALMAHLDVLLDPIHFGSGNTLYEAMAFGTPVVTWPGTFMRGRIVAGAYRQMGVADAPIALRLEDYAPLALALGRSPERRRALREVTIDAAKQQLFDDLMAVREFEIFLEGAVGAGRRGERLPVGWRADTRTETSHQGTSM